MSSDLTPGRELDERVARLVWGELPASLGWWSRHVIPSQTTRPATDMARYRLPRYSSDDAAALAALDALAGRGWAYRLQFDPHWPEAERYEVIVWPPKGPSEFIESGPTLPLAVCAAVLAALEVGQ